MREDIIAGLKNAYERGESVEKAVQAFISAGYNPNEVKEAAKILGFSDSQQEEQKPQSSVQEPIPQKPQFQPLPKSPSLTQEVPITETSSAQTTMPLSNSEKSEPKRKLKILNILLWITGLIILIVIGLVAWNFSKGQWTIG